MASEIIIIIIIIDELRISLVDVNFTRKLAKLASLSILWGRSATAEKKKGDKKRQDGPR